MVNAMASQATVKVWWHKRPGAVRVTVERVIGKRVSEREVGPRGLLDVVEAVAVTGLSRRQLLAAIGRGQLKARRHDDGVRIVLRELADYLTARRDDAMDAALARERRSEPTIPADEVFRRLGL